MSLGNTEFKVFIFIWSLKLEGGRSDVREGTVSGRKVQGLAHRVWGWYLRAAWTCLPSYRGDCPAQALCGNIISHSRISVLKTESGHSSFQLEEGKASTPWAVRLWVPILVPF